MDNKRDKWKYIDSNKKLRGSRKTMFRPEVDSPKKRVDDKIEAHLFHTFVRLIITTKETQSSRIIIIMSDTFPVNEND